MTKQTNDGHFRVVVDGSNIATEGRSLPSLAQLNDAVTSFVDEHPEALITVVVDATFGHRIDKSEVKIFDEAVAHNELVAPPAGAIGRGDAFVLSIANKVGATILSNDSFQEFHGQYAWLFDEGRLIGGKPVPNIGWVFVNRVPVKGPVSRKARAGTSGGGGGTGRVRQGSKMASQPMPVPSKPPPGRARQADQPAAEVRSEAQPVAPAGAVSARGVQPVAPRDRNALAAVNDLLPFLEFVERHPVGSSVTGVVESYSSHGAYVEIGDLHGYVPLRLMGSPPPRSAREVLKLGESATLVVMSFAPARRSVDLSLPEFAGAAEPVAEAPAPKPAKRTRSAKKAAAPEAELAPIEAPPAEAAPASTRRRRKAAPVVDAPSVEVSPADPVDAAAPVPAKRGRGAKKVAAPTPAPAPVAESTPAPAPAKRSRTTKKPAAAAEVAPAKSAKKAAKAAKAATKEPAPAKRATKKAATAKSEASAPASARSAQTSADGAAGPTPAKRTVRKKAAAKAPVS